MTEEEYFRKTYPDSCYGDKPLSPYWDFFQDGVEFGERQSEQKIEELKHNKKTVVHLSDCLEEKMKERIEELETRCTELFLQNNEFAERFEKSTEIIKGLLSCCRNYPQENAEKMEQAEQFIREIEK